MHTPPNGVILNLTPDATGIQITGTAIDPRVAVIRIQGVVTFPPVAIPPGLTFVPTTSIFATASQAVGRLQSVSGSKSTRPINYVAAGFTQPFTLYIPASSGKFVHGIARITLSTSVPIFFPFPQQPTSPSADVMVSLRPVRF
jgi:hypothetical protein